MREAENYDKADYGFFIAIAIGALFCVGIAIAGIAGVL